MATKSGSAYADALPPLSLLSKAEEILEAYRKASNSLMEELDRKWTDSTMREEVNIYGDTWTKGMTLASLVAHQTHHRGQMTVLMRQADLKVPGVYGPSKEEWAAMGMKEPA